MSNWAVLHDNETNELYHWGIKGMKWGIRRYQNPDGTLTEEGKMRYRKDRGYTSSFEEARANANRMIKDHRLQKDIMNKVEKDLPELKRAADIYNDNETKMNKLFEKKAADYQKQHGDWDGDGAEQHQYFAEKDPAYRKLAENSDRYANDILKMVRKELDKGSFDQISALNKYPDYKPSDSKKSISIDIRRIPIVRALTSGTEYDSMLSLWGFDDENLGIMMPYFFV